MVIRITDVSGDGQDVETQRDRDRRPPSAGAEWRALEEAEPGS